jgi:hypothetical protein
MMHEKLPPELRDIVYHHLYLEDAPICIKPLDIKDEWRYEETGQSDLPNTHVLDPLYLAPAITYEAFNFYFSVNTFSINTLSDACSFFTDSSVL